MLLGICVRLGVLTSAATLLAFGARWWWPLELLSHFRVQYLWLLAPTSVGLLAAKRYPPALLVGCCLLWNLALVGSDYSCPSTTEKHSARLRLMSANVHTGNRDYERFRRTVRSEDPDVLLVMEIDDGWLAELSELRDDYPHGDAAPRGDNFGIGLFSKVPVESLQVTYLGGAGVPSIQTALKVGDETINLVGTHPLPPIGRNSNIRNEQLSAAADLAAGMKGPVILAGDLNVTPWSPYFRDLLRRSGLRDSRCGFGVQASWPSGWGVAGIPIDHVLVSDDILVKERHIGPAFGSDHRAVIADLVVDYP